MRQDFVTVRLTDHGAQLAGEGEIVVVSGAHEYHFKRGEVRNDITRAFDWERVLAREIIDGKPLFEMVEEETASAAPAPPRKVKAARAEGKEN